MKRQGNNSNVPPYLIDPLQEKIHTLKNQLHQQLNPGQLSQRVAGLQKIYKSGAMGDPVLSQKNLASHNQQLSMNINNPVTHREIN